MATSVEPAPTLQDDLEDAIKKLMNLAWLALAGWRQSSPCIMVSLMVWRLQPKATPRPSVDVSSSHPMSSQLNDPQVFLMKGSLRLWLKTQG